MKHSFSDLPRPLLVGSLRHRDVQAVIEDIRLSESDGARAFILHIRLLDTQYHHADALAQIAAATDCPIMAIYYRCGNETPDADRIAVCERAVRAGFRSVDLPVYLFDEKPLDSLKGCMLSFASACPQEVSVNPDAVMRQKETAARFKSLGAEVLFSAHVGVELSLEQTVALALEMESRGADIVKIVSACHSPAHAAEILATNLELKKCLRVPYLYTCSGYHGRLIRRAAPLFGTVLAFGHHEYGELANREKPLLRDLKQFYETVEWRFDGK